MFPAAPLSRKFLAFREEWFARLWRQEGPRVAKSTAVFCTAVLQNHRQPRGLPPSPNRSRKNTKRAEKSETIFDPFLRRGRHHCSFGFFRLFSAIGRKFHLLGVLAFFALGLPARATSVIPPTFPELVAEADGIYRGTVTAIQARRAATPDGTAIIKTYVTFALERTLKGPTRTELTLELLGGTVGDETLWVTGMPKFALGSTEYVFVQRNGRQFCPLVALGHGRYRVVRNQATAGDAILRDNGTPLTDLSEVELQLHDPLPAPLRAARDRAAAARPLTPADFEAGIRAEVERPTVRIREN